MLRGTSSILKDLLSHDSGEMHEVRKSESEAKGRTSSLENIYPVKRGVSSEEALQGDDRLRGIDRGRLNPRDFLRLPAGFLLISYF